MVRYAEDLSFTREELELFQHTEVPEELVNLLSEHCYNCDKKTPEIITEEDELVCDICGMVKPVRLLRMDEPIVLDKFSTMGEHVEHFWPRNDYNLTNYMVPHSTISGAYCRYNRKFHFNEVVAQIYLQNPPIHGKLLDRIVKEASKKEKYGDPEAFGYPHVKKILRSVKLPKWLQEKFRSEPRPQNRYQTKPLLSLVRFTERWRYILFNIWTQTGSRGEIPTPSDEVMIWCKNTFPKLVTAFSYIAPEGRKHFLNYYYVLMKLFHIHDYLSGKWQASSQTVPNVIKLN